MNSCAKSEFYAPKASNVPAMDEMQFLGHPNDGHKIHMLGHRIDACTRLWITGLVKAVMCILGNGGPGLKPLCIWG